MSTYTCGVASINSVADYLEEQKRMLLAAKREELAGLRFSIILTAEWEALEILPASRRADLRTELSNLRSLYLDKIDEFAMVFCVQTAMKTKEEVEHTVAIPDDMIDSIMSMESDQLYF
jgi:hypothetical protein